MPDARPAPISVPLDAAGRTVRVEVVRGPRERDGRWYWRAREESAGKRRDVTSDALTSGRWLTAGEAHRALILYAADGGGEAPQARLRTLSEVLCAWVAVVRQRSDLAETSRIQYEGRARLLVSDPETAAISTGRITRAQMEDVRDRFLARASSKTTQGLIAVLRIAWGWARDREYVSGDLPRVRVRVRPTLAKPVGTLGEAAAILQHLRGWQEAAMRVILATGCRPGEACSITRASIAELDQGWLHLRGKTGPRVEGVEPWTR